MPNSLLTLSLQTEDERTKSRPRELRVFWKFARIQGVLRRKEPHPVVHEGVVNYIQWGTEQIVAPGTWITERNQEVSSLAIRRQRSRREGTFENQLSNRPWEQNPRTRSKTIPSDWTESILSSVNNTKLFHHLSTLAKEAQIQIIRNGRISKSVKTN